MLLTTVVSSSLIVQLFRWPPPLVFSHTRKAFHGASVAAAEILVIVRPVREKRVSVGNIVAELKVE